MNLSCFAAVLAAHFVIGAGQYASAEVIEGNIVGIQDGDTLMLLDDGVVSHRIRLAGIDAPEKGQPFGEASKHSLSAAAFGRRARADCPRLDRYRRKVCVVWVDDVDVNLEQVRIGLAWHYKKYAHEQSEADQRLYAEAEPAARAARRGLWKGQNPIPPWEWRRSKGAIPAQDVAAP